MNHVCAPKIPGSEGIPEHSLLAIRGQVKAVADALQQRYGDTEAVQAFRSEVARAINTVFRMNPGAQGNVPSLTATLNAFSLQMLKIELADAATRCIHAHGDRDAEVHAC